MNTTEETQQYLAATKAHGWWTESDFPVRDMHRAAFLIDGRMTMLEMCVRFLCARQSIYICAWGFTPDLPLVRGKHHRAGDDGSPEQEQLVNWLRRKGLAEEAIAFWCGEEKLTARRVLEYAATRGVDVRVLLWDTYTLPFQGGAKEICDSLSAAGIRALPDDSTKDLLNHPIASLHQKAITVDSQFAFVGGIDMMTHADGDFDRWDTKGHPYWNMLRMSEAGKMSHSWHDVHVMFEGTAVGDVEQNFCERWNDVIVRHKWDESLLMPCPPSEPAPVQSIEKIRMQVIRTLPDKTYSFAQDGIATILETYRRAIEGAQHSIYIENQYLWRRIFLGLENPVLGPPHEEMEQLFQALAEALQRGVIAILVLPDNPNVGREFTDDGLRYLWELAPHAVASGRLQVYTLGSSRQHNDKMWYRPIYVHSKVLIVDDTWLTLGSANINNRGMRDDAEINVAIYHPTMARGLRTLLMAEHLGLSDEDTLFRIVEIMGRSQPTEQMSHIHGELGRLWQQLQEQLHDPFDAMAAFAQQAKENLEAIKAHQPLNGHLLPYVRYDEEKAYEVPVHSVNGWLEALELAAEPQPEEEVTSEQPEQDVDPTEAAT